MFQLENLADFREIANGWQDRSELYLPIFVKRWPEYSPKGTMAATFWLATPVYTVAVNVMDMHHVQKSFGTNLRVIEVSCCESELAAMAQRHFRELQDGGVPA